MPEPSTGDGTTDETADSPVAQERQFALVVAPGATNTVRPLRTPNWQPGMDAFFRSALATYTTPTDVPKGAASTTLVVAATFMMRPGYPAQQDAINPDKPTHQRLVTLAGSAGLSAALGRIQNGRGTPNEIRTLVQAIINDQPATMTLLNTQSTAWAAARCPEAHVRARHRL